MRIQYLGPHSPLIDFLSERGEQVSRTEDPIESFGDSDFVISYGYRHLIKNRDELRRMDGKAINLHISYLPWNRGADPNLWSFIDDTPKGVTIHYMDAGVDTGDIIYQSLVELSADETLRSSYEKLHAAILALFVANWDNIKSGRCPRTAQRGKGSCHRARDRERFSHLLSAGWDTPVRLLRAQS